MSKLSRRQLILKKISKRANPNIEQFILDMREHVKNDPIIIKKFKEYEVPLDEIDNVHIEFCDLDVSAKTKNQKIYLNEAMLDSDSSVKDPTHYLVHELVHFLQQKTGNTDDSDADYLDKDTEEEAFKSQVDFKKRKESPDEAEEYVSRLLDHHDYKGKKRKEKERELLNK